MATATFDQALTLACQLTPQEQARLITTLVEALAAQTPSPSATPVVPAASEAWRRLFALSDEIRATYPDANPAARLEADRHERDTILRASDPRAILAEIRTHFAKLGPVSPSVGEQIDNDRQQRADFLEGKDRDLDVHS